MTLHDLSATISETMPVYPGDPAPELTPVASVAKGQACNVSRLSFGSHTGTHIDTPKHFIDGGLTCENIPLENFFGTARVLDLRPFMKNKAAVEAEDLEPYDIQPGEIVLLNLGNELLNYKPLSPEAARYLASKKIKTVGVDCLSVEAGGAGFPVHHILLGAGITIIEGLRFNAVPQDGYFLSALPLKLADGNGSPVRAALMSRFTPKAVLFDMDGLILDTEKISRDCWKTAVQAQGHEMTDEFFAGFVGLNRPACIKRLTERYGSQFDVDAIFTFRRRRTDEIIAEQGLQLMKGVQNLLERLKSKGIRTCVATSTEKARAAELLNLAGLRGHFDAIVGGDSVTNGKPHPDIFLKAAEAVNTPPEDCIALEDSPLGAEAAFRGGIRVIVVPDVVKPDRSTYAHAYAVCADLDEAAEIIVRQTQTP